MTPFLFGPPARRLFGLYHEPSASAVPKAGVLLCNPFGHEAIRVHRLYRVLAERLARLGHAVLRFDYFGTGDSAGDDGDGDLDGWAGDVLQAHAELHTLSGAKTVRWLGARLGGTVACLAADRAGVKPSRLVLWDPIVDGAAYARLLRVKHVEALELTYCIPDPRWRRDLATAPADAPSEAIGFALSPALGAQLKALRPASVRRPVVADLRLVHRSDDAAVADWLRTIGDGLGPVVSGTLDHGIVWTADPQIRDAVVPNDVLLRLAAALDDTA